MEMVFDQQIPEGYATIRRSKGRKKLRTSSASSSENQFELMEFKNNENNTMNRKYDSDTLYNNHQNDIYDGGEGDVDEGVVNDIDSDVFELNGKTSALDYYCDSKRTFRTFKPNNPTNDDDGSDKDLTQSTDCFQTLPYDIIMSPLKSPQYINQLNALRTKTAPTSTTAPTTATITSSTDAAIHRQQQFPLYARPDSPKYGKLFYNRSTSPSADSLDNCSSNSSTYSTNHQHHHHTAFKAPNISTSLLNSHDDDNMIVINVSENNRKPPLKGSNLNYRKSFSHVSARNQLNGEAGKLVNGSMKMYEIDSSEYLNYEKPPICTNANAMTKSLAIPSISTSQLYSRRFATLAHPKEKLIGLTNKSTSSLNDNHLIFWDPIMNCKIGSQTTLRTKPAVPWYELAIKKEHRQSCPPMQVNITL